MRIRVKDILEMHGSGMTDADVLAEFPYLQVADLKASQLYAAQLTDRPNLRSMWPQHRVADQRSDDVCEASRIRQTSSPTA